MSSCVFSSSPEPPLLYYDEGVGGCSGDLSILKDVRSRCYPLYGAIDCLDLLLLRGGRIIRWDNKAEKSKIESMHVCGGHLSSLLLDWDKNKYCFTYARNNYKKNSIVCGLPKITHKKGRPVTTRRVSKVDAIQYMDNLGVLCHVGTPICTMHLNAIKLSKFDTFNVIRPLSQPVAVQSWPSLNDSFDDFDDPLYVQPPTSREVTPQALEENDALIRSYRHHLIRCVSSEHDRREIIDNLEDGHALIVADYAMKLLPTDAIEKQSNWFAKCGVSFHMSAVTARINGELFSHAFGHLSTLSKQDSTAVSGILSHGLLQLKENGVTHVHVRTDNAANYHCIGLIATLYHMIEETGMKIVSHLFSEPQFGKGIADQKISLCKGKLARYIDSGKSACTATQMFEGFVSNILLEGCSFYVVEVSQIDQSRAVLNGVKKYSSFRFEEGVGVRVKRHDSIGEGMLVKKEQLSPITCDMKIHRKGGYTSGTAHFWKPIKKLHLANAEVEEEATVIEEKTAPSNVKLCPDELCRSKFLTNRGLESHLNSGRHSYYKFTESVTDFAAQRFSELLETTETAQLAVRQDSIVPIATTGRSEEKPKGWALRSTERASIIDKTVKDETERMIQEEIDANRRAEAREIRDKLRELRNTDGSYRFSLKKCLNEGQVKSQITRVLNKNKKDSQSQDGSGENEGDEANAQVNKSKSRTNGTSKKTVSEKTEAKRRGRKRKCAEVEKEPICDEELITGDDDDEDFFMIMHEEIKKAHDQIFLKE